MSNFVDSGPKFTGLVSPNAGGIGLDHVFFRFWISCLIAETFAIKVGSCVKSRQILHVFGPQNFFRGGLSEFWELHYKAHPGSDHAAKFHCDQPTEFGDPVAK